MITTPFAQIIADLRAVPKTVPYDKLLNDLGWEMNSFLTNNGATFDGRVFNNMKGFIKQMIEKWVSLSSDPAFLNALTEATSRAERMDTEMAIVAAELDAVAAERDAAVEALKPFADQAETFDSEGDEKFVPDNFQPAHSEHTIGDLRRAREIVRARSQEKTS
jgi:hypothetical protein